MKIGARPLLLPVVIALTAAMIAATGTAVAVKRQGAPATTGPTSVAAEPSRSPDGAAQQETYLADLRPIAEAVFDQVQALSDAENQFDDDESGGFRAYVDAVRDDAAGVILEEQHEALRDLTPSPDQGPSATALDLALTQFELVTKLYRESDVEDRTVATRKLNDAGFALETSIPRWISAIDNLYGADEPAVPYPPDALEEPLRRPVSPAAYLLGVGRVCGRLLVSAAGEPNEEPTSAPELADFLDRGADRVNRLVGGVLEVKAPTADRDRLGKGIVAPLRAARDRTPDLKVAATALRARDLPTLEAKQGALDAFDKVLGQARIGFLDYGSSACAALLPPSGGEQATQGGSGTPT